MSQSLQIDLAEQIASLAAEKGLTVSVAESLTGGQLAARLAAAPNAADWFLGGVVAYASKVKFDLLGVEPGPVVTEDCALAMARGVAELLKTDVAVAATGVGGPDQVEGKDPGTVWLGAWTPGITDSVLEKFDGEIDEIVSQSVSAALHLLKQSIEKYHA